MIGGLNVAAVAFGLAACAVTFAVVRRRRAMRDRQPQRDEVQQLLALLCERLQ